MGRLSQVKGANRERELVNLHRKLGIPAQRVPLSGGALYQGNGEDLDIYIDGVDQAPLCCQVKAMKSPRGIKGILDDLADSDALFIRLDAEPGQPVRPPTVVLPWSTYEKLLKRRR